MKKALSPHCSILSWCLMPNHFHWLVVINEGYELNHDINDRTKKLNPLNRSIGSLLSSYTQLVNQKQDRTGSLFRKRTKAKPIDNKRDKLDNYLLNCFLYIHQNPIRSGLVKRLEDWEFSSYKDYCGLRNGKLCNKDLAIDLLHIPNSKKEFQKFSNQTIPEYHIQKILKDS
jgi:REP element-mobilizing transposase RayT